jgi:hypothetical protein
MAFGGAPGTRTTRPLERVTDASELEPPAPSSDGIGPGPIHSTRTLASVVHRART